MTCENTRQGYEVNLLIFQLIFYSLFYYTRGMANKKTTEEFTVNGEELVAKVKALVNEGNIRRIIIKDVEGKTLVEFPLTIGVIGAVLAPILAAVGAIAALVTKCTIVVERREN